MKTVILSLGVLLAWSMYAPAGAPGGDPLEKATLIQPTDEGGLLFLTRETAAAPAETTREDLAQDETPRKARLAVVPAIYSQAHRSRFKRELYENFGISDPGIIENPGFTLYLTDSLVNSRKFDILEREDLRTVARELQFGESDYADPARVVRMGSMLNADYMVIPEIRFIHLKQYREKIPYVGASRLTYEGKIAANVRVVEVGTSRVASSSFFEQTLRQRERDRDHFQESRLLSFVGDLYSATSREVASRIISDVYPIRIMSVAADVVTLNRGRGAIEAGEVLDVYKPGEVMVDPATGERLGYDETRVGRIRVFEVASRLARGRVIEASEDIEEMYICRRSTEVQRLTPKPALGLD